MRRDGKIIVVVIVVLAMWAALIVGAHFVLLYKTQNIFDGHTLRDIISDNAIDGFIKTKETPKCTSVGYLKFDCTAEGGLLFVNFTRGGESEEVAEFGTLRYSSAYSKFQGLSVLNIKPSSNEDGIDDLIFPLNARAIVADDGALATYFDGGFGNITFTASPKDKTLLFTARNADFTHFFYEVYKVLQSIDEVSGTDVNSIYDFERFANESLDEFAGFPVVENSPYYTALLDSARNIIDKKSDGLSIKVYLNAEDKALLQNAIMNFVLTGQVEKSIFDLEISNL